jgi:hypothetical protein
MSRLFAVLAFIVMTMASPPWLLAPPMPLTVEPPLSRFFAGPPVKLTEEHVRWRDSICSYETRGLTGIDRLDALSNRGATGACQVLPTTARESLGFIGRTPDLFREAVTFEAGARMVALCLARTRWQKSLHAVAHCYYGGPRRRYRHGSPSYWYARSVEQHHATRELKRKMALALATARTGGTVKRTKARLAIGQSEVNTAMADFKKRGGLVKGLPEEVAPQSRKVFFSTNNTMRGSGYESITGIHLTASDNGT